MSKNTKNKTISKILNIKCHGAADT